MLLALSLRYGEKLKIGNAIITVRLQPGQWGDQKVEDLHRRAANGPRPSRIRETKT